jgi:hypothetical protein
VRDESGLPENGRRLSASPSVFASNWNVRAKRGISRPMTGTLMKKIASGTEVCPDFECISADRRRPALGELRPTALHLLQQSDIFGCCPVSLSALAQDKELD